MLIPFLTAVGLVLIMEGLMPFATPRGFRRTVATMLQADDRILRIMGLLSMAAGIVMLYVAKAG